MKRKMAKIKATSEFIINSFRLPDNTKIYDIHRSYYVPDCFEIWIEHPDFDELQEGSMPPYVYPTFEADRTTIPPDWRFKGWGK
jgi:hypothetical protein